MKCKKITQGAVYPLASLSIQLSWIIPEYCSHFSPPLLCCQMALSAFLTQFQGGGSGLSVSHRCTNKEQLFLFSFSFPQKATLKYRLWQQAVSFSALKKEFIWHEKLYSHCLVALSAVHKSVQLFQNWRVLSTTCFVIGQLKYLSNQQ